MLLVVRLDWGLELEKENGGKELAIVDVDGEKESKELAMELLEKNMGKVFAVDDLTELKVVGKVLTKTVGVWMDDEAGEEDKLLVEVEELVEGADRAVRGFSPRILPWPGKGSLTRAASDSARRRD